jgi:5,10-methylenetetrahydromethanopterin reductase
VVGIGAGLTGRLALGKRPLPWREVASYTRALRGLLRGAEVEWEGAVIRMSHPVGFAPPRPIEVPIAIAAQGPRGLAVARDLAGGLFTVRPEGGFASVAQLVFGTVLDPGEDPGSERVLAAAGHAVAARYHSRYDGRGWGNVERLPRGGEWRRRAEAVPKRTRHLAIWTNHLVGLSDLDREIVTGEMLTTTGQLQMPRPGEPDWPRASGRG